MSKLSTFLTREREKRGWTRQDLADKSGIPYPTIARWENPRGRTIPDHEGIKALARAFGMPSRRVLSFIGYPLNDESTNHEVDERWERMRKQIETDPRAERVLELFDQAAEDETRDAALTILETFFATRRRRRAPPR